MKIFSTLVLLSFFVFTVGIVQAQVLKKISSKVEQKAKERIERKTDQTIDKGLDKAENSIDSLPKKMGKRKKHKSKKNEDNPVEENEMPATTGKGNNQSNGGNNTANSSNTAAESADNKRGNTLKVDSKFDFIPGDKIVLLEDFSNTAIGDFPAKWLSNGSGEVVTLNNEPGKFLQTKKEVVFYHAGLKPLPDEFTLECDLQCNEDFNYYSYEFAIGMTNAKELKTQWNYFGRFGHGGENNSRAEVMLHPNNEGEKQGLTYFVATHKTNESIRSNAEQSQLSVRAGNTKVHISIWRQKQRVRVYLNDKKVWDIPTALEEGISINNIYFRSNGAANDADAYYLTNIKLATGNTNTRSKLLTDGKYSTSNILFDVNSDVIKPESYGVLKDIASVLNEDKTVTVKIVGHTDNDGDDAVNITLSQKRAAAVKEALKSNFGISDTRMQTDGKGETQPVVPNTTPEAKAQNRRVEFIKL